MKLLKYSILIIPAALFLGGCSGKSKGKGNNSNNPPKAYIDPALLDTTIHPADDFFEHVNKKWLEKNPIPSTKSSWGMFSIIEEQNQAILNDIQIKASKDNTAKP